MTQLKSPRVDNIEFLGIGSRTWRRPNHGCHVWWQRRQSGFKTGVSWVLVCKLGVS